MRTAQDVGSPIGPAESTWIGSSPSLITAELMPCTVVVYLLSERKASSKGSEPLAGAKILASPMYAWKTSAGQQSWIIVLHRKLDSDACKPLSTALYLTNICECEEGRALSSKAIGGQ